MSRRSKIVLLGAGIVVAAFLGRFALGEQFEAATLIARLRDAGSATVAIPLFFLIFAAATSLFTPAVALMLASGVVWGFWPGWLIVWVAANLTSSAHFAIGRLVARDSVREWLEQRGARRIIGGLESGGVLATIMIRQLPLPFLVVNLSAGATPLTWPRWLIGNAIGLLPNCIIYTQLAAAVVDGAAGAREVAVIRVLISGAAIIGLSLVLAWLQRRLSGSRSREVA